MKLKFTKMHGAGNDFVVIDAVRQAVHLDASLVRRIADRHFGVGADQILLVEPAGRPDVDFRYRIFNADGGEVEQCGNGARCFVRFVRDQGLTEKLAIKVETLGGIIEPRMTDDGRVAVDMGVPRFEPTLVPFDASGLASEPSGRETLWSLALGAGRSCKVAVLSMGNPHAVQLVEDVDQAPVERDGPAVEAHHAFPNRVNAGFMQVLDPSRIRLRVYERGAGETLACGSGACAAVVSGIRRGLLRGPVDVQTRGGVLTIDWAGGQVMMTGPAEPVFNGLIELADIK